MMQFSKHLLLFFKNNLIQLKRKWLSLPLLFLFPLILMGIIFTLIVTLFIPSSENPIQLGIVDLDQSEETTMMVDFISDNSELGSVIEITSMSEKDAKNKMKQNNLSAYITFPENFTFHLYEGRAVTLPVTGNQNRIMESYLIKELADSVSRLISAAQANILTINHYTKQLDIDEEARYDLLYKHFTDFLFFTVGKDQAIDLETVTNQATSSPIDYYVLSAWFIVTLVWLFILYNFLYKDETIRIKRRMTLYNVKNIQEIIARMLVSLCLTLLLSIGLFFGINSILEFDLIAEDYIRLFTLLVLSSIIFLELLAIIETLIKSQKIRLLCQFSLTMILILMSGAIIPEIYFPLEVQEFLPYIFTNNGFSWIIEIILNERFYADYIPLLLMSLIGFFSLLGLSLWKERI